MYWCKRGRSNQSFDHPIYGPNQVSALVIFRGEKKSYVQMIFYFLKIKLSWHDYLTIGCGKLWTLWFDYLRVQLLKEIKIFNSNKYMKRLGL